MSTSSNPAGASGAPGAGADSRNVRSRIIDALMALAAERPWDRIGVADIAARADVSLADFLGAFPSKGAALGGFMRMIDLQTLASHAASRAAEDADIDAEPARERVFDVIMLRLDQLAPYKAALRAIIAGVKREPLTIAALNKASLNSWRFMLAAAAIDVDGPLGGVRIQGAALVFARTLDVWIEDDEPGLARTLARLDRELDRGGKALGAIDGAMRLAAPFCDLAWSVLGGRSNRKTAPAGETRPEASH